MSQTEGDWVIRRPRHPALLDANVVVVVKVLHADSAHAFSSHLIDISLSGAQLSSPCPIPPGTPIEVSISDGQRVELRLAARVQWNRDSEQQRTFGCAFDRPLCYEELGELFLSDVLSCPPNCRLGDAR